MKPGPFNGEADNFHAIPRRSRFSARFGAPPIQFVGRTLLKRAARCSHRDPEAAGAAFEAHSVGLV